MYPVEYLALGRTLEEKLLKIKDGNTLMLFLWKIHNTVNSSVDMSLKCKDQEKIDTADFSCSPNGDKIFYNSSVGLMEASAHNLGRTWPTAARYEFWLKDGESFSSIRDQLRDAHVRLNAADQDFGSILRQGAQDNAAGLKEINDAIAELDQAVLDSGILRTEYALSDAPICEAYEESIESYELLDVPLPIMTDGNLPFVPPGCFTKTKNSEGQVLMSGTSPDSGSGLLRKRPANI